MFSLLYGLFKYLFQKDEYYVVLLGNLAQFDRINLD